MRISDWSSDVCSSDLIGLISLFGASALRILPSVSRILGALQTLRTLDAPLALADEERTKLAEWPLEPLATINAPRPDDRREPVDMRLDAVDFQARTRVV